jgi:hypothetical protein
MVAFVTTVKPAPTGLDYTQVRTVSVAEIPQASGARPARVTVTRYDGKEPARSACVSVFVPGGCSWDPRREVRVRYVRVEMAERVAQRVACYVEARWGLALSELAK